MVSLIRETNTYYLKININKFLINIKVDEYQEINLYQAQKLINIEKKFSYIESSLNRYYDILEMSKNWIEKIVRLNV